MNENEQMHGKNLENSTTIETPLFNIRSEDKEAVEDSTGFNRIPNRTYFRIGDVADITGIKPYVLRFWEKEFSILRPIKNDSGQRVYQKRDLESVLLIKRLLYKERYSIVGAIQRIKELRKEKRLSHEKSLRGEITEEKFQVLDSIRSDLCKIIDLCEE